MGRTPTPEQLGELIRHAKSKKLHVIVMPIVLLDNPRITPAKAVAKTETTAAPPPPPSPRKGKLSYKDQRDYDLLPARIEELDAEIARGEHALADPDLYSRDPAKFARYTELLDKLRTEKEAAEERWLALAEMVEG